MLLSVEFGDEALETLIGELSHVVSDEHLWNSKSGEHVSLVEMKDVVQSDFC